MMFRIFDLMILEQRLFAGIGGVLAADISSPMRYLRLTHPLKPNNSRGVILGGEECDPPL